MASETLSIGYIAAKTVKVEIIRQADAFRYDWFDGTFKAAGWTTKLQTMTEDASTAGRYTTSVDPAAWNDGAYDFSITDTLITTNSVAFKKLDVISGQFGDNGTARAAWYQDVTVPDQDTMAGVRAGTKLMQVWRRFIGGKTDQTTTNQRVYKKDNVTVLATRPVSDDGTTQVQGPGA